MLTHINSAIQLTQDIVDRETNNSFINNVSKITKLIPRSITINRHEYSADYIDINQYQCLSTITSKNIIMPVYDYIKFKSKLIQAVLTKTSVPSSMLYYVEFDNGMKFELHQDTILLCRINKNYEAIPLKDIAVGTPILTVANTGCKLSMKINKSDTGSQETVYQISNVPDEYYYTITNCNNFGHVDAILVKDH